MDQVGVTVLPRLKAMRLSHIYQSGALRPLNALPSPSVSLNNQLDIVTPLSKLNSLSPPTNIAAASNEKKV